MLIWFFNQLINDLQAQSLLLTNQRHLSLMHFSTRCNSCQCVSYMRTKVTFLFSDFILNVNRVCFPFLLHAWKIFHKWCLNKFCSVFYFHFLFIFLLVVNIASSLIAGSFLSLSSFEASCAKRTPSLKDSNLLPNWLKLKLLVLF